MHRELACGEQMLDEDVRLEDIETYTEAAIHPPHDARRASWLWDVRTWIGSSADARLANSVLEQRTTWDAENHK